MSYKITGTLNLDTRVMVINESDWTIESNIIESSSTFEITTLSDSGKRLIVGRDPIGRVKGYGNVTPEAV